MEGNSVAMVGEGERSHEPEAVLAPTVQRYLEEILLRTCSEWFAATVGKARPSMGVMSRLQEDLCTADKV